MKLKFRFPITRKIIELNESHAIGYTLIETRYPN